MNKLVIIRIIIGAFFVFSGFEKLMSPIENFQSVVESYEIMNHALSSVAAFILPWVELFLGVFVILGLWLKISLRLLGFTTIMFMAVVAQAILRNLPITECGCFGELISIPLPAVLLMDSIICIAIFILIKNLTKTSISGLDNYFLQKSRD